jgi:hypothetical protein
MNFARNCHFTIRNGKIDEFNRLMKTEVLPLLNNEKGAETYNTKTYPEVLKKLNPVLEGTPRVDTYDTMLTLIH